jgi:hypothetical protein
LYVTKEKKKKGGVEKNTICSACPISYSVHSFILKMEEEMTSETLRKFYHTKQCHNPEDSIQGTYVSDGGPVEHMK